MGKKFVNNLKEVDFHPVVPFNKNHDRLVLFDFSEHNTDLIDAVLLDTTKFSQYIHDKIKPVGARYGIGGYAEHRTIYKRSNLFSATKKIELPHDHEGEEPRRFHLGIDIWGRPFTPVMAPIQGMIHSFAFNNLFGDYGATIILSHHINGLHFHTLYGHLSLASIRNLKEGDILNRGDVFAEFGIPQENGNWPPHLHFQIIKDMQGRKGDYPGVCKYSERAKYMENCPDADMILRMMEYAKIN